MTDSKLLLGEMQQDLLIELLNIGMGRAAASLSQMVNDEVTLAVPAIEFVEPSLAATELEKNSARNISGVSQNFTGPFWGEAMLLFPQDKSLELVRALMQDAVPLEEMTDMEEEALLEVGNIILNACLGSLGNMLTETVSSSLPQFTVGSCEQVLAKDVPTSDDEVIMLLHMDFSMKAKDINGFVMFVVDIASIEALKAHIDHYLETI